jgi:hypothetical protein
MAEVSTTADRRLIFPLFGVLAEPRLGKGRLKAFPSGPNGVNTLSEMFNAINFDPTS